MRSISGDYSLRAAVHRRLPPGLFSTKRTKPCPRASPTAIGNSVQVLTTSCPSTTATKFPWVETVAPVEPGAVSNVCVMRTGKDKFQHFGIWIAAGGRCSWLSTFLKSLAKCAPPAPHCPENDRLPFRQRALATGPSSDINGSPVCLTREKGCSNHPLSSDLSDLLCGKDCPPDYVAVMPEPQGPEEDQGTPSGDAVAAEARHNMSLDPNPTAGTGTCDAVRRNCVIGCRKEEGFPDENVDDCTTCLKGEGPDLEAAPSSILTLASSSVLNPGPTHEVAVSRLLRQPVVESNFLNFYSTLKPYVVRRELPSRFVQRIPPPIDLGPLPESGGLRVLEGGPFTTPAGGTSTSRVQEPQSAPPPLPTNGWAPHGRESGIKPSDPCLDPAIPAPTDPISRQLVSQPIAPARLSDEVLRKTMTWDIDILHARTGFSQTLNSRLRSMQNKWQILAFELALETSDASMFRDDYGFASKPLALQLPCSSPRITELDDKNEPVLRKAAGEVRSCNGGASGSVSARARQGSGARANSQQSRSAHLQRGKKRANDDDDDDRKGKKKERREEPPVGGDPPPPEEEGGCVRCPYWIKYGQNCKKKSCIKSKKNLSKLKEHLRRAHFLPLGCPFEGCKFLAGDKFQIKRHQKTFHLGQAAMEPIIQTTDSRLLRKNIALGTRNLTWAQIYEICFREEPEEPVTELIMSPDFESEDEGEEEEDDEDQEGHYNEGQEGHDDREAHERVGRQDRLTSNRGAAAAVEENHQEIPTLHSSFEANRSMPSNGAPTIIDTPQLFLVDDDFPFGFPGFPSADRLEEGHLLSPAPDPDNFHNPGQPPPSSPGDVITWETVESFAREFGTFYGTFSQRLGNRNGDSPRAALQDMDKFFRAIGHSAEATLNPVNSGSGHAAYYARDLGTYPALSTGQHSLPLDSPIIHPLFQVPSFSVGGGGSTPPSLTHDSESSYNYILRREPPVSLPLDGMSPMASGSQPTGSGVPEPLAGGGSVVQDYLGHDLAHKTPAGNWSVVPDPLLPWLGFSQTHP